MKNQFLLPGIVLLAIFGSSCATAPHQDYARLGPLAFPSRYEIFFNPHLDTGAFEGSETIELALTQPTRELTLHSSGLVLDGAKSADGVSAEITADPLNETVRLVFKSPLSTPTSKIQVRWHGQMRSDSEGFYRTKDRGQYYAMTHFEPTYARRMFPCFDEPALKAVFKISAEVDTGLAAISNGKVAKRTPSTAPGRELVEFEDSPRQSTYLVALAIGPFSHVSKGIVTVYLPAGREGLADLSLTAATASLRYFNKYFGVPYPYSKLDMVACPNFSVGGMENTAAIFYAEARLLLDPKKASKGARRGLFGIVAHEIAHQWFGDLVTMKWWDDLWLNEAFATFMASKAVNSVHPEFDENQDQVGQMAGAMARDSFASTHPVHGSVKTPGEAEAQFDSITYIKGASTLRMLETYVTPENFRLGIKEYLEAHKFANATADDLWTALSHHAEKGRDVQAFAHSWFDQPGVPVVSSQMECPAAPSIRLEQQRFYFTAPDAVAAGGSHWPIPLCVRVSGEKNPRCSVFDQPSGTAVVGKTCPEWVYPNANVAGYYRSNMSAALRAAVLPQLSALRATERRAFWSIDTWPEFKRGGLHAFDLFETLQASREETAWRIWGDYTQSLEFVRWALVKPNAVEQFEKYIEKLYFPVFERMSKKAAPNVDDRTLKSVAFNALGELTASARIQKLADDWLAKYEGAPSKFDPELTDAVVRIAARFGGATRWDHYYETALKQADPRDRLRYIAGLGLFRDAALIDRALKLTLARDILHDQERSTLLGSLSGNIVAREILSKWIRAHWEEYVASLPHSIVYRQAMASIGGVCTPEDVDSVVQFFKLKAHRPEGYERDIEAILDNARKCVELRLGESREVHRWLKHAELH